MQIPETGLSEKNFICGGISKCVSVLLAYPLTTVRTRIQQDQFFDNRTEAKYRSVMDIGRRLVREEGVRGFYKGLGANMAKGIPQRGVYFYFYEWIKQAFVDPSTD